MDTLTRRKWSGGLVATLAMLSGGCLTMSPAREQKLGREEADEVERTMGLVRDPRPLDYVRQVGGRLAQGAGATDVTWQFNIADDPEPNAFALPGGFCYVTRGLLAFVNTEDELAGVMGHEITHVLERHAARRVGAATPFAVLFGVPAAVVGVVSPTLGGVVSGTGRLASSVVLNSYSREQEHDADAGGIALAARAGWDPAGLASFLRTLDQMEALAGGDPDRPRFLSTHPSGPDRERAIESLVRGQAKGPGTPIAGTRAAFLERLEGLVVGDNPATGVFLEQLFVHPEFDVALLMPQGWKTVNSPEAAGAVAPSGTEAAALLTLSGEGSDPVAGARADGLKDPQVAQLQRAQIAGLPAARLRADTRDGNRMALTWIAHRQRVFRVTGVGPVRGWESHGPVLERVAESFRPLRQADRDRIMESRLRIRRANAGETVAQVLARGGSTWNAARIAVANGTTVDTKLDAGWPVKVPVSQRYTAPARP